MNIKTITMTAISCVLIIVGSYFASTYIYRIDKTELVIKTQPLDANITINGSRINANTTYLASGKYRISATKKGYFEHNLTYEVNKDNNKISIKLEPLPEKYTSKADLGSDFTKLAEKYPIVNYMPYEDLLYTLDYQIYGSYNNGYHVELVITAGNAVARRMAIQEIKDLGFNPADYRIKFVDFESDIK